MTRPDYCPVAQEPCQAMCSMSDVRCKIRDSHPQQKQEPVGHAGVRVWVGDQQVCRVLTQLELHRAVSPWRTVEMAAMACIAKLREKNL